jgi:hypothetical protein
MKKSSEISKDLQALELEASNLFSELLNKMKVFDFAKQMSDNREEGGETPLDVLKDCGEVNSLPYIEVRNEITGTVKDFNVISVSKGGIDVILEDTYDSKIIKFEEIGGLSDTLILINEMEELLK